MIKFLLVGLLILYGVLLCVPINLVTADLGRHLKNGEIFIQTSQIVKTNFYSYTYPDFLFVNHHWGSGVIFYLFHQLFGFIGLSVIFVMISVMTLWLFIQIGLIGSSYKIIIVTTLLALPLLIYRTEVRPELFSYFFIAFYLWFIAQIQSQKYSRNWLLIMPVLQLIWVNLHIYFFFGLIIIGLLCLEQGLTYLKTQREDEARRLIFYLEVSLLSAAASLINPFGISGLLYPAHIFDNYGYQLLENQPVWFLERLIDFPVGIYFKVLVGIFIFSLFVLSYSVIRQKRMDFIRVLVLSLVVMVLALTAVRNFTLFGYLSLVVIALNLDLVVKKISFDLGELKPLVFPVIITTTLLALLYLNPSYWRYKANLGLGLAPGVLSAASFFKEQNLSGPIFNNYDNGGYLIYTLYPKERPFVDNRPEAYPKEFFEGIYVPMQQDPKIWLAQDQKYHFNAIFFYRHDLTQWAQNFLRERVLDQNWVVVYLDQYAIIFLKQNQQNREIIQKYQLPKELFSVHESQSQSR